MTTRERSPGGRVPPIIHVVNLAALLLGGLLLLLTAVDQTYQLALLGWILLCEHIVLLDNALGTQISTRLSLGLRLQAYVDATLNTPGRLYLEPCCDDPLAWHYRPGSIHRETFDCPACNAPYEVRVDETGYLNRPLGLMLSQPQIDLFW